MGIFDEMLTKQIVVELTGKSACYRLAFVIIKRSDKISKQTNFFRRQRVLNDVRIMARRTRDSDGTIIF